MKYYNVENYVRYKLDLEETIKNMKKYGEIVYSDSEGTVDYNQMANSSIIKMWMPLCEALARKFATSQQASGVMDITDLISCGHLGLCKAVAKLDRQMLADSEDPEKTIKSFLSKRIRGAIRREIDKNRGDMRIPEHKYNEIRKNFGKDKKEYKIFDSSNCQSLTKEGMEEHLQHFKRMAKMRDRLVLKSKGSVPDLLRDLDPDWDHNYEWDIGADAADHAKKVFREAQSE